MYFPVHDEGDETNGVCYESLVRKILSLSSHPAVVLLFQVFSYDWNLQERLSPVGYHYHLPMVSLKDAVTEQFALGKEEGRVLSKNQFFYDAFHPSNIGHKITAQCIMHLFEEIDKTDEDFEDASGKLPGTFAIGGDFQEVHLLDREDNRIGARIECGDFCDMDVKLQSVERNEDEKQTPQFPCNWFHTAGERPFAMDIICKALFLIFKDSPSCDAGKARVYVDGERICTLDPREVGWIHCHAKLIFNDRESRIHKVEVKMEEGQEEKQFTILGFGYVP